MRLLKKYRTYTYTSLVLVVLIGFISNYHLFRRMNFRTADEVLYSYQEDIKDFGEKHGTLEPLIAVNSKFGKITRVGDDFDLGDTDGVIKDTLAYDYYQEEQIIYRKMLFSLSTGDGKYLIRLMLPTLEEDYLVTTILFSLLIFTLLFILFTSMMDYLFTRHIFSPFYKILELLKTYNLEKRTKLNFAKSDIDEFNDLSRILMEMIHKINKGYYEMKEFLEYTSHELKTPLSIIQLKLETLNQHDFQDPEVVDSLSSIQCSLRRVVRFNRSILLIAKIRNGQFSEGKIINLRIMFSNYMKQYEEMLLMKQLSVTLDSEQDFRVLLHPILAEHLVQNIFVNAVKHNYSGGKVHIRSYQNRLIVTNTFKGEIPEGNLFEKYNRTSDRRDSSGLGLAISKTICVKNGLDISYQVNGNIFTLTLQAN